MIVILLLWLSLFNPARADRFIDGLAGAQHEYKIALGGGLLATVLLFVAAVRGSRWWYLGVALPSNLQGLYRCDFDGDKLDYEATLKLLKTFSQFR